MRRSSSKLLSTCGEFRESNLHCSFLPTPFNFLSTVFSPLIRVHNGQEAVQRCNSSSSARPRNSLEPPSSRRYKLVLLYSPRIESNDQPYDRDFWQTVNFCPRTLPPADTRETYRRSSLFFLVFNTSASGRDLRPVSIPWRSLLSGPRTNVWHV